MSRATTIALASAGIILAAILTTVALAGPLSPSSPPTPTHHTLTEIYDAITNNSLAITGAGDFVIGWDSDGKNDSTADASPAAVFNTTQSGVLHAVILTNTSSVTHAGLRIHNGDGTMSRGIISLPPNTPSQTYTMNMRFEDGLAFRRMSASTGFIFFYKLDPP
ncbi:MAG: hypothetical protein ACF8GE_01565 [Phycisphaerales bacterium JB043]